MQGKVQIDIEVSKADFSQAEKQVAKFARDTGKALDPVKNIELDMNVANATLKLEWLKKQLKSFKWDIESKKQLIIDTNNAQSNLTEAKRQLQNFKNTGDETLSRLQKKFDGVSGSISTMKIAMWSFIANLATSAIGSFQSFLSSIIQEAEDGQRAFAQLDAVIASTWWSAWVSATQVSDMATELSVLNGIQDDVIMSAQNMLLTFTNIKWGALKETTQAVIDLATAMNWGLLPTQEDLRTSSIQVGKALNDPIKGVTALQKVWVTFDKVQKEQIKNFIKAWDVASAQKVILNELNKEFWGSAQAQMATYWGQVAQLSVRRANFKELLWKGIIPVLVKLIGVLNTAMSKMWEFIGAVNNGSFFDNTLWKIPAIQNLRAKAQSTDFVKFLNKPLNELSAWNQALLNNLWVDTAPASKTAPKKIKQSWYWTIDTWGGGGGTKTNKLKEAAKSSFDVINTAVDQSKSKLDEYKNKVKEIQDKFDDLKTKAKEDIAEINYEIASVQNETQTDLAKRYAEIVAQLKQTDLTAEESKKLSDEKLFIEGKVSAEIRNQAVEYSKLSEAQKIVKDNEQKITDLKEKQSIAQALINGKLVETATGGVWIQDANDPKKITEITNLKNQQYALDLVNQQTKLTNELALEQTKVDEQQKLYQSLADAKLEIEQEYTKKFWEEIQKQKSMVDELIAKVQALIALKASAWVWNGVASSNATTNNKTVNIVNNNSNNVDVKQALNEITKAVK